MMLMARLQRAEPRRGSAQEITYRWLKQRIASVPRYEGAFLTEAEVAAATETSRTPVRESLLRLQAEGFVQIVPKKGAFVPPISDTEVEAVMQARGLVEDWCTRQVAAIADHALGELDRLVGDQERLLEDPVGFIDCDRAFHRTIVRAAGNPVLADFYESLRDRQVRMGLRAIAAAEDRARRVLDEHAAIVTGLRSGDPELAARALATHLAGTLAALRLPTVATWSAASSDTTPGDQR